MTIATVVAVLLVQHADGIGRQRVQARPATIFIAMLLILAVIEHWFLVLPLPAAALWNWSLRARQARLAASEARLPKLRCAVTGRGTPVPGDPADAGAEASIPARNNQTIGGDP